MRKTILSSSEEEILKLSWQNMTSSEISEHLGKKIVYISKTKGNIRNKINEGLEELAKSLQLDYDELNRKDGRAILSGYNFAVDTKVYLFFTLKQGFIAWYRHIKCKRGEDNHKNCQETIDIIKNERNIPIKDSNDLTQEYEDIWNWIIEKGDMPN